MATRQRRARAALLLLIRTAVSSLPFGPFLFAKLETPYGEQLRSSHPGYFTKVNSYLKPPISHAHASGPGLVVLGVAHINWLAQFPPGATKKIRFEPHVPCSGQREKPRTADDKQPPKNRAEPNPANSRGPCARVHARPLDLRPPISPLVRRLPLFTSLALALVLALVLTLVLTLALLFVDRPSSAQRQKNAAGSAAAAPASERPAPVAPAAARAFRGAPLRRTRRCRAAPPRAALAGGGSRRRRRPLPPQYFNLASHEPTLGGQPKPKYLRLHKAATCA